MKTKKISWQAIAIVVLALVLIASIALGVSGAWFQDKDSEKVDATMGQAVTIKLANNTADNDPVKTWNSIYTGATKGAFPGDTLLGATKVVPGSTAPMILRAKILTKIMDGETEVTKPATEPTLGDEDNKKGTDYADTPVYTDNEKNYNAWVLHTELAKSGLDIGTEGEKWIKGNTKIESEGDVTGGSEFYYYNKIVEGGDVVLFSEGLNIPVTITNAANGWKITVTILVEAMQAANIADETLANPWQADLPSVVATTAKAIIR